jgi:hypothetical protein
MDEQDDYEDEGLPDHERRVKTVLHWVLWSLLLVALSMCGYGFYYIVAMSR